MVHARLRRGRDAGGHARDREHPHGRAEFIVDDGDAEYARRGRERAVAEPSTLPWGNRSLLLRDPDGNLVNLFTPVTEGAVARFAGRRAPSTRGEVR